MDEIVLYDLPSKGHCACWSLNPWKVRLVLNFKGLDYKTEWLEYPDIEPTMKSFGLPPNAPGEAWTDYTIPAVRLPGGRYVMESKKIAAELERRYPSPPLHLDSPLLLKIDELKNQAITVLRAVLMPDVHLLLNERSDQYFVPTREAKFGMSMSQLKEKGGDHSWTKAEPTIKEVGELLRAEGGPFLMGKTASFADFVLVGLLQFIKRTDEKNFDRLVGIEPALKELYDAAKPWLERDDY